MGLDITYGAQIKRADIPKDTDEYWDYDGVHVYPNHDGYNQSDGLVEGMYDAQHVHGFRAGSYSSYNRWRERLSLFALGVMPEVVWNSPGVYEGKPFVELIYFSDCEGVIGPKTSAKLAQDFDAHAAAAKEKLDEYDLSLYEDWRKAFHTAADEGAVIFH